MVRAGAHSGMKQPTLHFVVLATLIGACDLAPKDGGEIIGDSSTGGQGDASESSGDKVDTGDDSDPTGGESGVDGEGPTDAELCEDSCVWETTCDPGYEMTACIEDCLFNLGVYDGDDECDGAQHKIRECMADFLACSPTPDSISAECMAAFEMDFVCEAAYSCPVTGMAGGELCSVTEHCGGPERSIECDADTCTCSVDGEVTGTCPFEPGDCDKVSGRVPEHDDFPAACCGFEDWAEP